MLIGMRGILVIGSRRVVYKIIGDSGIFIIVEIGGRILSIKEIKYDLPEPIQRLLQLESNHAGSLTRSWYRPRTLIEGR